MNPLIVTGSYGTGKTEFVLQYAYHLRKQTDERIYIADLDVINPYFRSRERQSQLAKDNIEIVGSSLENSLGIDLPALSFGFVSLIRAGKPLIVDLAGSENGLKVLAGVHDELGKYDLWCVVNVNRPESSDAQKMINFVRLIQGVGNLKVTGLVNNTHMLHDTTANDILHGQDEAEKAAKTLDIPVTMTLVREDIQKELGDRINPPTLTFQKLQMRESWQ